MTARRGGDLRVDLNADLGEGVTDDPALLAVVTSANVACGYHAGDDATMREVCAGAAERGVSIGAQVSYADRANFGRVALDVAPDLLREQVADQVGRLADAAARAGLEVSYLKPHGALYHRVRDDAEQAAAVLAGAVLAGGVEAGRSLPVLGMPGRLLEQAAAEGRAVLREGFPDRGYDDAGRLLERGQPGAVLEESEEVAARAVALARGELPGVPYRVDSVCVHGDTPGAVGHAWAVRLALTRAGIRLTPIAGLVASG